MSELNFVISQIIGGELRETPIFREEAKRNIWSLRSKFPKIWFLSLLTILNNYNKNHKNLFFRVETSPLMLFLMSFPCVHARRRLKERNHVHQIPMEIPKLNLLINLSLEKWMSVTSNR